MPTRFTATPLRVRRWTFRLLLVSVPVTMVSLGVLITNPDFLGVHPVTVFAIHQAAILTTLGASVTAAVTGSHLAISQAFVAGYHSGQLAARTGESIPHSCGDGSSGRPPLHLVE